MEPVHYVRILRRRIKLILALTVCGALLGAASTLASGSDEGPTTVFLATHVLRDESSADDPLNLEFAKLLATTTGVSASVAEAVGGDPLEVASHAYVIANPSLRTLEVLAVDKSPERAEQLANAYAAVLVDKLLEDNRSDRDGRIATLQEQITGLEAQLEGLVPDQAETEAERDQIEDQRATTTEAIADLEGQRQALEAQPLPAESLDTLDAGPALEMTGSQVQEQLAARQPKTGKPNQNPTQLQPVFTAIAPPDTGPDAMDNPAVRALVGAVLGFLLGIAAAVLINRFDPRLRTKDDAEAAFGLPVIAEIPLLPKSELDRTAILAYDAPRSPTAEAYRALRSSLVFLGNSPHSAEGHESWTHPTLVSALDPAPPIAREARVIMVTSPGPGEGKTTSSANLAAVLAEAGFSVLAINCDFRKPRLHKYLRAQEIPRKVVETGIPGVRMICDVVADSRRLNPAEIVAAQRKVVQGARELFDIIVLDTAPILTTNDAIDLLPEADLVVVFSRAGKTTREAAQRTAELLERHGAPMAGCALVGVDEGPSARYYYYYNEHEAPAREAPFGLRSNGNGNGNGNGSVNGNGNGNGAAGLHGDHEPTGGESSGTKN